MSNYQAREIPAMAVSDQSRVIPYEFANFTACQNPEWMSPNGTGAFGLYDNPILRESDDPQEIHILLNDFTKQAESDDHITDDDVALAAQWVKDFRATYGEHALFYFYG